jgi:hypothetical protein
VKLPQDTFSEELLIQDGPWWTSCLELPMEKALVFVRRVASVKGSGETRGAVRQQASRTAEIGLGPLFEELRPSVEAYRAERAEARVEAQDSTVGDGKRQRSEVDERLVETLAVTKHSLPGISRPRSPDVFSGATLKATRRDGNDARSSRTIMWPTCRSRAQRCRRGVVKQLAPERSNAGRAARVSQLACGSDQQRRDTLSQFSRRPRAPC